MKNLYFLFLILACLTTNAQINLDSLRKNIENSTLWENTKTVDYLSIPFQHFERIDKLESFDIFIDSNGNINEYLGLTAVYKQFDNQNRITKNIGYNFHGNYFFWDYSPIITTQYHNDTTIESYFNNKVIFTGKSVKIYDIKGRLIEESWYDQNNLLYSKVKKEYLDLMNILLIKTYDGNGNLKSDKNGLSIRMQLFDSNKNIIQERFYDSQMNLINASHHFEKDVPCNYSIIKRKITETEERIYYYNSKEELQCVVNEDFSILIIQKEK